MHACMRQHEPSPDRSAERQIDGRQVVANDFAEMLVGVVGSSVELLLQEKVGSKVPGGRSKFDAAVGDVQEGIGTDGQVNGGRARGGEMVAGVGVKRATLTRVSMSSLMIQNWSIPEHLDVLTRFVDRAIGNFKDLAFDMAAKDMTLRALQEKVCEDVHVQTRQCRL